MKRVLRSRPFVGLTCLLLGASLAGGIAWAVTVVPPKSTDRYFACVGIGGRVRQDTVLFNHAPTSCPGTYDTVRSWNAQGPQGPAGPPGVASVSTLTVTITDPSSGFVVGSGIQCSSTPGADCTEVFPTGTTVLLTATPNTGLTFAGWTGDCSGTVPCSLVVTGAMHVDARFGAVTLTKAGVLAVDANSNGTLSPNDVVGYTLTVKNLLTIPITNQVLEDAVGAFGVDAPRSATLIAGSVTTTAGTITEGNTAGDSDVTVSVASIPANGVVTVRFRATAHPKTVSAHGVTFGPFVLNSATLNGNVQATDPDPPQTGPCTVGHLADVCMNADAAG